MDAVTELFHLDFTSLLLSVFVLLFGTKSAVSILEWTFCRLGLETKWTRQKREEHSLLIQTSHSLAELQEKHRLDMEKSDRRDSEIDHDIKKLTAMFVEKQIDDMRWEINNFATNVSEGKPCNKDSFTHCIRVYEKYEKLLSENGLENGEVELSMELINNVYRQKLKDGEFAGPAKKEEK